MVPGAAWPSRWPATAWPDMAQARRRLSVAPALTRIAELSRPEILARLESALDEQAETAAIAQNETEHTLLERPRRQSGAAKRSSCVAS